ncbi:MAG: DUF4423 domain-containing protein [Bdellovibrio sp.]|nr:DUF4423 domain-containing protein [Bdellovibrio sp.]
MQTEEFVRQQLNDFFKIKRAKNGAFSVRAMAQLFKTSPGQMSQILSGKRPLSRKFINSVSDRLDLPKVDSKIEFSTLPDDEFKVISDWHHFAILSMSKTSKNKADPKFIAQMLGIDYYVAKEAFERLSKLGLIGIKDGFYTQTTKPLHTTNDIPSAAIRSHHKQNLTLASEKLDEVDVELREFTSMTMALNSKKLPSAKKLIRKFKADLYELVGQGKCEDVYTFSVQLFPVTKINIKNKRET